MKQAKPTEQQFDRVVEFLQGLEAIAQDGYLPGCEEDAEEATPDAVFNWLHDNWPTVGHCWQRVLWAGQVCITNACDPALGHLEFKPEIVQALAIKARVDEERASFAKKRRGINV